MWDINLLKQKTDASGKKLTTFGNEYIRAKDELSARKVLVKMFQEISIQTSFLAEQNAQTDRNQKGIR
ncbi:hypothetical protein pfor_3c0283 [Rhodobacteraceae bacterium SB2]|nr:hypothetical protein pfor_3c0283 [Rhodobacteraceae bacterium SB2]